MLKYNAPRLWSFYILESFSKWTTAGNYQNIDETHNHEISKILYSHLPNQWKITPENKAIVIELMDMKANKKLIQQKNHEGKL